MSGTENNFDKVGTAVIYIIHTAVSYEQLLFGEIHKIYKKHHRYGVTAIFNCFQDKKKVVNGLYSEEKINIIEACVSTCRQSLSNANTSVLLQKMWWCKGFMATSCVNSFFAVDRTPVLKVNSYFAMGTTSVHHKKEVFIYRINYPSTYYLNGSLIPDVSDTFKAWTDNICLPCMPAKPECMQCFKLLAEPRMIDAVIKNSNE
ncbi:hypothetical protein KUTeg_018855 [Tegillarca granosa]|uniref:Uncharacterized protein n=1 Tax=Tegillarca granosa TaxID=220873 RepID=A0ABQ9ED02_TEGGR|nr:hypothetical protein KUTeg_018855 [Tegillarca granosa]